MQLKTEGGAPGGNRANREDQATSQRVHDEEYNYQYYEEFKRLYQTASLLSMQLRELNQNKEDLWVKIGRLEKKTEDFKDDIRGQAPERKKRTRRTAEEISRNFICSVERCQKCYGSEGSLQQHIKLKHPELYESKSQNRHSESQRESEQYSQDQ